MACSYDATAAKANLMSLVYGLKNKFPIREFYALTVQQRQINPTKKACAIMHMQGNVMLVKDNCFNLIFDFAKVP